MLSPKNSFLVTCTTIAFALSGAAAPTVDPITMCGGAGWTGPTTCPPGFVCSKLNDYVSLCVREVITTTLTSTRPPITLPFPEPTTTIRP
ncbi:hypothetical protein DFP72DRAFT_923119 [Ephemerocybe angulata]|uniref:CBM1 domain-containing protein n=1 Tax=Ephemerocybe angulata TaxID=980116 RepID=A0A8H6LXE7_9AGAR|nr:hypothetical protein DFP72DRAFT_923119 [Tulosesus angulatus]